MYRICTAWWRRWRAGCAFGPLERPRDHRAAPSTRRAPPPDRPPGPQRRRPKPARRTIAARLVPVVAHSNSLAGQPADPSTQQCRLQPHKTDTPNKRSIIDRVQTLWSDTARAGTSNRTPPRARRAGHRSATRDHATSSRSTHMPQPTSWATSCAHNSARSRGRRSMTRSASWSTRT